jgi:hypothetical protein
MQLGEEYAGIQPVFWKPWFHEVTFKEGAGG